MEPIADKGNGDEIILEKLKQFISENNLNVYDIAVMTENGIETAFCQPCNPCNDS